MAADRPAGGRLDLVAAQQHGGQEQRGEQPDLRQLRAPGPRSRRAPAGCGRNRRCRASPPPPWRRSRAASPRAGRGRASTAARRRRAPSAGAGGAPRSCAPREARRSSLRWRWMASWVPRSMREAEAGGELAGPHHAHRVLLEAHVGVADRADQLRLEIGDPADVVDDREVGDVVEQRVDREVAPEGVLLRRAEGVVAGDQQVARLAVLIAGSAGRGGRSRPRRCRPGTGCGRGGSGGR